MRIVSRSTLRAFVASLEGRKEQPAVSAAITAWIERVSAAQWANMADVKRDDAKASVVTSERVVFNIKGNSYRLVAAVDFKKGRVFIKWLGSHRDYDDIDVRTVNHER